MDGQPASNIYSNDDEDYSNEWSNTANRCYHARSHLQLLRGAIDMGAAKHHGRPTGSSNFGTRNESPYLSRRTALPSPP